MTNKQKIANLATILESYCKTDDDRKCVGYFTNTSETNESEMILELVNALHDGLSYGNWPWVIESMRSR